MVIDSISNAATSYSDYNKGEQKSQMSVQNDGVAISNQTMDVSNDKISTSKKGETGTFVPISQKEENQLKGDTESNSKRIKSIVADTNNKIKGSRRRCEFAYHEEINRVSIKVLDEETNEVIREIPPEETLEMLQKLWEMAGLLVDERR